MEHHHQVLDDLRAPSKELRREIPDVMRSFASMHGAALAEGELSRALKEGVALAISVVKRCDGCIAYHAKGAARAGATKAQIAELLGVTLLMDGGTASVYAPRAWEAFLEFSGGAEGEATT